MEKAEFLSYAAFAERFQRGNGKSYQPRTVRKFIHTICPEAVRIFPFEEMVEAPLVFRLIAERTAKVVTTTKVDATPAPPPAPAPEPKARRKPGPKPKGFTCFLPEHN